MVIVSYNNTAPGRRLQQVDETCRSVKTSFVQLEITFLVEDICREYV